MWAEVRDLGRHVEWMQDAVAIRFTSSTREGTGTTFDCDTRVGPIRLTDRMEVTAWDEGASIAVRHVGVVTGDGRFTLAEIPGGRTLFAWEETLRFPWWLGGPIGAVPGGAVLRRIWRANLAALKRRIEDRAQAVIPPSTMNSAPVQ